LPQSSTLPRRLRQLKPSIYSFLVGAAAVIVVDMRRHLPLPVWQVSTPNPGVERGKRWEPVWDASKSLVIAGGVSI
jgi:hypothetical protein